MSKMPEPLCSYWKCNTFPLWLSVLLCRLKAWFVSLKQLTGDIVFCRLAKFNWRPWESENYFKSDPVMNNWRFFKLLFEHWKKKTTMLGVALMGKFPRQTLILHVTRISPQDIKWTRPGINMNLFNWISSAASTCDFYVSHEYIHEYIRHCSECVHLWIILFSAMWLEPCLLQPQSCFSIDSAGVVSRLLYSSLV